MINSSVLIYLQAVSDNSNGPLFLEPPQVTGEPEGGNGQGIP